MLFMQFRIGSDMAICLIKSILFAMLSVFVVMPGLLMLFGPYMDRPSTGTSCRRSPSWAVLHGAPARSSLLSSW